MDQRYRIRISAFAQEARRYLLAAEAIDIFARVGIEAVLNTEREKGERKTPIMLTCDPSNPAGFVDARNEAAEVAKPFELFCYLLPIDRGRKGVNGATARKTGITLLSKAIWVAEESKVLEEHELVNVWNERDLAPGGVNQHLLNQFEVSAARHRLNGKHGAELIGAVAGDLREWLGQHLGKRLAEIAPAAAMAFGNGAGSPFWHWAAEDVYDIDTDLPMLIIQAAPLIQNDFYRNKFLTAAVKSSGQDLSVNGRNLASWLMAASGVTERHIRFADALMRVTTRSG